MEERGKEAEVGKEGSEDGRSRKGKKLGTHGSSPRVRCDGERERERSSALIKDIESSRLSATTHWMLVGSSRSMNIGLTRSPSPR